MTTADTSDSPLICALTKPATGAPLHIVPSAGSTPLTLVQLARAIDPPRQIYSFKAAGVEDQREPHATIGEMAAAYVAEILETQPSGPYLIAGHCFGGVIAYEMAAQLENQGQRVALLSLLDTFLPVRADASITPEVDMGEWEIKLTEAVTGVYKQARGLLAQVPPDLAQKFERVLILQIRAGISYRCRPVQCPIAMILDLAGGPDAPIVVIPTAGGADEYDQFYQGLNAWRDQGATNLTVLHTKDRSQAESDEFVRAIREASGVWFPGGRQWHLADSYLDTQTERELHNLLDRGGVIGGSSAGATIQGSYLVRGDTGSNEIMMGDHVEGFGFLTNSAIDQHLLKRNRQFDLVEVIQAHPELLGIGIDENTAIVVTGNSFEVIGESYVAIFDNQRMIGDHGFFFFLSAGDRFDLVTREAQRPSRTFQPVDRATPKRWPGG